MRFSQSRLESYEGKRNHSKIWTINPASTENLYLYVSRINTKLVFVRVLLFAFCSNRGSKLGGPCGSSAVGAERNQLWLFFFDVLLRIINPAINRKLLHFLLRYALIEFVIFCVRNLLDGLQISYVSFRIVSNSSPSRLQLKSSVQITVSSNESNIHKSVDLESLSYAPTFFTDATKDTPKS